MAVRLIVFSMSFFLLCISGVNAYSAGTSVSGTIFDPFDDDPTIYNDCNYCHGLHNARRDVSANLNEHEERYDRYLGGGSLVDSSDQSVFSDEISRKCPRSRAKEER